LQVRRIPGVITVCKLSGLPTFHSSTLQPATFNLQRSTGFAWVSLDPDDNDPVRFWRYVLTASRAFEHEISQSALALLNHSPQPPFEALLTGFINQADLLESKAVLVLDDYHIITAPQIHETLAFFLEHLPPTLHVIMLTRSDLPLPLARLRARNELYELRAEDLRFSLDETQAFVERSIPANLSLEIVTRLAQRTVLHAAALDGADSGGRSVRCRRTRPGYPWR